MKRYTVFIIIMFVIYIVPVIAQDNEPNELNVQGYSCDFYAKIFGSWDFPSIHNDLGMEWDFSWGKGEIVREMSVMIDWGLFGEQIETLYIYTGSETYEINSISEISENIFRIDVKNIFSEVESRILIHWKERDVIWFESVEDYHIRKGLSSIAEYPLESIIYDVRLGEENIYLRRSGPEK
ncbi:MAG: hypothetical protein KAU17_15640 [Spirochaetales bacterium]|nr:hypothetical protein [Spirochaetales bacterium]